MAWGVVVLASACGSPTPLDSPEGSTYSLQPTTPTTPSPASSAATSVGDRIPTGEQRSPSSFTGADDDLATAAKNLLIQAGVPPPASNADMASVGREFCSVLSSGGEVARKVDYWAGQHRYAGDDWAAVFLAALRTDCPEFMDGYVTARRDPPAATAVETADLARFDATLAATRDVDGATPLDELSDTRVERLGARVCREVKTALAGGQTTLPRDHTHLTEDLALLLVYCPRVSDDLSAASGQG